jgi:peptidoglycan/LPS O-acetylase OafA/YrhL
MKRIDNLTGIRAIAALWVVIYHTSFSVDFHGIRAVVKSGWMGVDIFYVLSGLVLTCPRKTPPFKTGVLS